MDDTKYIPSAGDYSDLSLLVIYPVDRLADTIARFQLEGSEFRNLTAYRHERSQIKLKYRRAIINNINGGTLKPKFDSGTVYDEDGLPEKVKLLCVNLTEFAKWAREKNINCPQVILDKFPLKTTATSKETCGKPKGYLAEAIEYVYSKLGEHGKSGLAKPRMIREFIIFMKEMATKTSRYADEFVMERIKSIQIPEEGDCIIITENQIVTQGEDERIKKGKPCYMNNDVSKILSRLRKNNSKSK